MSWAIHRFADGDVKSSLPFYQFSHVSNFQKDSLPLPSPPVPPPSSSGSKISPAVLFIIVILAVIFFVSGLLHLLIRFLVKHQPSSSSSPQSNSRRYPRDFSGADALQRQLQQLFHLHDSGLDQAFIDALPVFLYRELVGPKEPFDCAVCLCEFADEDKLRLLPICSHAFHINCIDTWLLSNSTCPLCRGSLFIPDLAMENPVFDFDDARGADGVPADREDGLSLPAPKPSDLEEGGGGAANGADKMILPVRLGKFRSILGGGNDDVPAGNTGVFDSAIARNVSREEGESSSSGSSIDGRRCYSMGSYQYVVGDSVLRVALDSVGRNGDGWKSMRRGGIILNSGGDERLSGKRLCVGSKKESFSVSKIWQWSNKKGKFPIPADAASFDGSLPWMRRDGGGEGGIH